MIIIKMKQAHVFCDLPERTLSLSLQEIMLKISCLERVLRQRINRCIKWRICSVNGVCISGGQWVKLLHELFIFTNPMKTKFLPSLLNGYSFFPFFYIFLFPFSLFPFSSSSFLLFLLSILTDQTEMRNGVFILLFSHYI